MPITIKPQLNLPLELPQAGSLPSDSARTELVGELANLIFLFWETANNEAILPEDKIDE